MSNRPAHRPKRSYEDAERLIIDCELETCVHCGQPLVASDTWHMRKYVQTLDGPVFVAGKSKHCTNPACPYAEQHYHASGVLKISLPHSTYGLDVLAFIGWEHEHEHHQFTEIHERLEEQGVEISERHVGRLYRQFLALLGGATEQVQGQLAATAEEHGGLIWALDALQPQGHGTLLYVLYEVLSGTPVAALQTQCPTAEELAAWLAPYQELPYPVLATLSDGEDRIIAALKLCWPEAPHQRCQEHILGNLATPVLEEDHRLRAWLREELTGLPPVPTAAEAAPDTQAAAPTAPPPFLSQRGERSVTLEHGGRADPGDLGPSGAGSPAV